MATKETRSLLFTGDSQSLDHLICSCQHVWWNCQPDLLGRLEIDHQLEFCWLLDGEFSRLGALQDLVNVDRSALETFGIIGSVGHEPTGLYVFSPLEH